MYKFHKNFKEKGSALLVVIFTISILLIIGLAILEMITNETLMASYLADQTKACYLAEAGIRETLAMLKQDPDYKYSSIWFDFLSKNHTLGEGFYKISIEDLGKGCVKISSLANVSKAKVEIQVEAYASTVNPVFYNALSVDNEIFSYKIKVYGDVYANGDVSIKSPAKVYGNLKATGKTTGKSNVSGKVEDDAVCIDFPDFEEDVYKKSAKRRYIGDYFDDELFISDVMFVDGNVTVNSIGGDGALYATGNIYVRDGRITKGGSGYPLIISPKGIILKNCGESEKLRVSGILFSKNISFPKGENVLLNGSAIAEDINLNENIDISYDNAILNNKKYLLPGCSKVHVYILSWYQKGTN